MERKTAGIPVSALLLLSMGVLILAFWAWLLFGPPLVEPANPTGVSDPLWVDVLSRCPAWFLRGGIPALGVLCLIAGLGILLAGRSPRRPDSGPGTRDPGPTL